MMEIHRIEAASGLVYRLRGDLDEQGAYTLRVALLECAGRDCCHVVMNMKDLRSVGYLAIGVLAERQRLLRMRGGGITLAGASAAVRRVFDATGASAVFSLCDSEQQAIEGFRVAA